MSLSCLSSKLFARPIAGALVALALFGLAGCGGVSGGGGGVQYTVGGTVTGLAAGKQVVLSQNGTQTATVTANGTFQFGIALISGVAYNVTVATQPTGQNCTVVNAKGSANSHVKNVAVTCTAASSRYVYAVNAADNTISSYTLDSSTGLLSALATVPANTLSGTSAYRSVISPDGNTLFVLNPRACCASSANVSVFTVDNASGTLSFASTWTVGNIASGLAVDGTGSYVFVASSDGHSISTATFDRSTGLLSSVGNTGLAFGAAPLGLAADPSGRFLYSANSGDESVTALRIGSGGALTVVGSSPTGTGSAPSAVATDPSGRFAYVANPGNNTITAYRINSTSGALTQVAATPSSAAAGAIAVAPNGRWVLATGSGSSSVMVFSVNDTSGALTFHSSIALAAAPQAISIDATSRYVYATSGADNKVSTIELDPSTGLLSFVGSLGTGAAPIAVLVAPGN